MAHYLFPFCGTGTRLFRCQVVIYLLSYLLYYSLKCLASACFRITKFAPFHICRAAFRNVHKFKLILVQFLPISLKLKIYLFLLSSNINTEFY
jgi:hypothetical protein